MGKNNSPIFIMLIVIIALLAIVILLIIKKRHKQKTCTAQAKGTVVSLQCKGLDAPTIIAVKYTVDSIDYELKESLKLTNEIMQVGGTAVLAKNA